MHMLRLCFDVLVTKKLCIRIHVDKERDLVISIFPLFLSFSIPL